MERGVFFKFVNDLARIETGDHVFIGRGTQFDLSGALVIGTGCLIAPGCFLTDHNHGTDPSMPIWRQPCKDGPVKVGNDVWLGAKVIVLPGVTIGEGAVVAAGAVVSRDVAPMSIVAGVPARLVRMRT